MTDREYLGRIIKQAREEKGWTQQELADEMDIDLRTVRKVEDGKGNPLATVLASYIYLPIN